MNHITEFGTAAMLALLENRLVSIAGETAAVALRPASDSVTIALRAVV